MTAKCLQVFLHPKQLLLPLHNAGYLKILFVVLYIQFMDVFVVAVKITEEVDVQADVFYPITCGDAKATLIWKKFVCPGINVKCVQVCAATRKLESFQTPSPFYVLFHCVTVCCSPVIRLK